MCDCKCKTIENLISDFNEGKINKIELLQEIQDMYGYLPEEVVRRASKECKVPLTDLYGIATFYKQFNMNPPAKYNIDVCTGTACYINGAQEIVDTVKRLTGIEDKVSKDNKFSLNTSRCIGCCAMAPVMVINGETYGHVTAKQVEEIIKGLE